MTYTRKFLDQPYQLYQPPAHLWKFVLKWNIVLLYEHHDVFEKKDVHHF